MTARHAIRGLIGVLLGAAAIVIAALQIYELVRVGSCASGGPYLSARPCPSGTGWRIVALIGAIFVLAPGSVFVFGSRTKGIVGVGGYIGLLWSLGWIAMATAAWVAGHGPAHPASGGEGSTGVAITFWAIGGLSLVVVLLGLVGAARGSRASGQAAVAGDIGLPRVPPPPPRPTPVPEASAPAGDIARRLAQLDELRALGAVTPAEYDAKRRDILGDI